MATLAISTASSGHAQVPAAPQSTIWRFMGIPQGLQKIRDVTINRRGNHPNLERKPPLKRIGDPANLESTNPAIKAAAEIKVAEDMKAQKIKAIKFLAKMGCGCYDKEGKITDALIAAMDDCTPDVRLAAIEAIGTTASGECCSKCGSTSCCSEKVTKRLSEIAYERDDSGCHLEPSAEIRKAAADALCICCPNRATGPIEEDVPEETLPEPTKEPETISGEGETGGEAIQGEGGEAAGNSAESVEDNADADSEEEKKKKNAAGDDTTVIDTATEVQNLTLFQAAKIETSDVEVGSVKMIGGMAIQPVTISPVTATEDFDAVAAAATVDQASTPISISLSDEVFGSALIDETEPAALPAPIALPIHEANAAPKQSFVPKTVPQKQVVATVIGVDQRTGRVILRSGQAMRPDASVTVYHQYLTGERLIAHLLIKSVNGNVWVAVATDEVGLIKIEAGDRAVCF
ncbi:MAG: hypothetical protein KDB00_26170 [Planctomycetales bacterium]|nr:hypothetical protein [Planctomycetales bacterium]